MTSASFRCSHCDSEAAVGGRRDGTRRANFRSVIYPRLLCDCSSLYSSFHRNLQTSSRSEGNFLRARPPLAVPARCASARFSAPLAHARKCRLVNSSPLKLTHEMEVMPGCKPPVPGRSTKSAVFSWRIRVVPAGNARLSLSSAYLRPQLFLSDSRASVLPCCEARIGRSTA